MNRAPDWNERRRALDPAHSFIVEAPAGSGKTTLLVQRFLTLLAVVDRPEAVVAMTFTRKAAAEMRQRVLDALQALPNPLETDENTVLLAELAQAVLEHDRKFGWGLASDSSRLQIQTIDSLCSMLTRAMPVMSRLGAAPEVVEHADELYLMAARRTLQKLAEGDAASQAIFRHVSLYCDNDLRAFEQQVKAMLEKREQWREFREQVHPPDEQVFCDLLRLAEQELTDVFREAGKVDFTAITRAAIDALGTPEAPSDLLYWLDYRIQHLLVDEFQDTSRSQYELLKALTEQWSAGDNRTLFLVGDPMQSIYRFRQAEVSVFLNCWERGLLGDVQLERLRLIANFRSAEEIVNWAQSAFAPVLNADDAALGAVKLRPAVATRQAIGSEPKLLPFIGDSDGRQEAAAIVEIIKKAANRSDIAILVRGRTHLASILPALRAHEIAYEAIEIDELREQQHIQDVLSLARAILHAGDRTAWLACLRAPWCGLTLADLTALAENDERTILDLLSDPDKTTQLSPDARMRAGRFLQVINESLQQVGRVPLRGLLERTWIALGGPAALSDATQREDVQALLALIEQFEQGGVIRDFTYLDARLQYLYARTEPSPDRVKIMTIHGAKGLEFGTVILPQLGRASGRSDPDMLVWDQDRLAAAPPRKVPDAEYERICQINKEKDANEMKRLFYVAATRAKDRLYLLGNCAVNPSQGGVKKASSNTFLGLLWPQVQTQFDVAFRQAKYRQQGALLDISPEPRTLLRRLDSQWKLPRFQRSVRWTAPLEASPAAVRRITYEWVSDASRHAGTLVHQVIKRMADEGVEAWSAGRIDGMNAIFSSELERLGVARAEIAPATHKVVSALKKTLRSERGRWILSAHTGAQSEWMMGGTVRDKLVSASVDRTFRSEDGRLWIIDFKTSEHEGANLSRFLQEEQRRYRDQLESYAVLMSRVERGPIWLGLYFPLLDAWREWQFAEAAQPAS